MANWVVEPENMEGQNSGVTMYRSCYLHCRTCPARNLTQHQDLKGRMKNWHLSGKQRLPTTPQCKTRREAHGSHRSRDLRNPPLKTLRRGPLCSSARCQRRVYGVEQGNLRAQCLVHRLFRSHWKESSGHQKQRGWDGQLAPQWVFRWASPSEIW